MDLGEALRRCRTLEEGLEFFKVSVAAWPDDPRLNLGAGVNAQHLGLLDVAAGYYEVAARIAADGPVKRQALVNRAAVDHERGAMELAIAGYRRVLDDFPEDTQALNNLGAALVTIGEHEQAMAVLDKCLEIDGDQPQALTNLAMHHANEGAVDEARDLLHRARRLLRARAGGNDNRGTSDGAGLLAREVTMMRPMVEDAGQMYAERLAFAGRVLALQHALKDPVVRRRLRIEDPVTEVEHVHFYVEVRGGARRADALVAAREAEVRPRRVGEADRALVVLFRFLGRLGLLRAFLLGRRRGGRALLLGRRGGRAFLRGLRGGRGLRGARRDERFDVGGGVGLDIHGTLIAGLRFPGDLARQAVDRIL